MFGRLSSIAPLDKPPVTSNVHGTGCVSHSASVPASRPGSLPCGLLIKRHDPFIKPFEGMQCELCIGVTVTRGFSKVRLDVIFGVDGAGRPLDRGAVWRRKENSNDLAS